MYHYGAVLFVVCAHIFKLEPFGKLHIELYRTALPRSSETVGEMEVELRTVESAVAFVYDIILTHFRYSLFERLSCKVPVLNIAHMILGHCRYFNLICQTEYGVNLVKQSYNVFDLVLHLIPCHKDMSVVLCKATDAEESVKCAGKLVTVYNAEFAHTEGKITIGMHFGFIDKHTARAVHRLYGKICAVDDRCIHIVFIMCPVTGTFPERAVKDHRCAYFNVAVSLMDFSPVFDECVAENHTVREEEREAGTFIHYCKETELLAEFAVITFLCFFKHIEISGKCFLCRECRAVNSLEHFVL